MTGFVIPFTGLKRQHAELREALLEAWDRVAASGCLMDGHATHELEHRLARINGVRHAVLCHSGTQALEALAEYFHTQSPQQDQPRVVLPTLTYVATANAFMRAGWDLWFADVDRYGVLDPRSIPRDLDYKALVMVGLYGASLSRAFDVDHVDLLLWPGPYLIEDAAQNWLSADCHRLGEGSAISFDPMKNISANGNGGAVVTNSEDLRDFVRSWRSNGGRQHHIAGTNSRMSEMDAASVLVRWPHLQRWQERRRQIAGYWSQQLGQAGIRCLIDDTNLHDHGLQKFVIDIDRRDQVRQRLIAQGIEVRVHYEHPLHEISVFRQWPGPTMLSTATALSRRVLSLPFYPELTDSEVELIVTRVKAACA